MYYGGLKILDKAPNDFQTTPHGQGRIVKYILDDSGVVKYMGGFRKGRLYFNNKLSYEGSFKNGKFHGDGTVYYPDGVTKKI